MRMKILFTLFLTGAVIGAPSVRSDEFVAQSLPDDESLDSSRATIFREQVVADALRESQTPNDITSLAIPSEFKFPRDAIYDYVKKSTRNPSVFLIDVNHYTGRNIDFSSFRIQHIYGIYVKATQGTAYNDNLFPYFYSKLDKLENSPDALKRGAYHFLSSKGSGADQARHFLDALARQRSSAAISTDLPLCVDFEWDKTSSNPDQWDGQSSGEILQKLKDWVTAVRSSGYSRKILIYTAKSFLRKHKMEDKFVEAFSDFPIWVADYSASDKAYESPSVPGKLKQALWQFSADAQMSTGYVNSSGLDASIFYGSEEQFNVDFGR